jgi:hypothetical protein
MSSLQKGCGKLLLKRLDYSALQCTPPSGYFLLDYHKQHVFRMWTNGGGTEEIRWQDKGERVLWCRYGLSKAEVDVSSKDTECSIW